jgi:uncharacterized protein
VSSTEILVGLVMLVGLIGVFVPVFPGLILIVGAALVWAAERSGPVAWGVFAVIAVFGVAGLITSTVVPARRASASGAPAWVVISGCVGMVIGFFAIPVVGALIGFPAGVLVAELLRHRRLGPAWRSTRGALASVGIGIAIQLVAGVAMIAIWAVAVAAT